MLVVNRCNACIEEFQHLKAVNYIALTCSVCHCACLLYFQRPIVKKKSMIIISSSTKCCQNRAIHILAVLSRSISHNISAEIVIKEIEEIKEHIIYDLY